MCLMLPQTTLAACAAAAECSLTTHTTNATTKRGRAVEQQRLPVACSSPLRLRIGATTCAQPDGAGAGNRNSLSPNRHAASGSCAQCVAGVLTGLKLWICPVRQHNWQLLFAGISTGIRDPTP